MNSLRKLLIGGALAGSTLVGGALGASLIGVASAQTATTEQPAASSTERPAAPDATKGGHQANGITETLLTGDDLSKATAAASEAVPGGTVVRAETDAEGDAYEVHMTKADGSEVTVKLDSSFAVTSTVDGMG
jgi:hypothetical protein